MFWRNSSGMPRRHASSMKCAPFSARLAEQDAVVREDRDRVASDVREAAHQRRAVARLELGELRCVDDPRDHLADVVRLPRIARDDAVQLARVARGLARLAHGPGVVRAALEPRDDLPHDAERVLVVERVVIGDAAEARVHVGAAQLLGRDDLAGGRLHERRSAEKDRALVLDDHRLVRHRGDVRAACRARAHHGGDLRNVPRAHAGLVVEDAAEVVAVGEHVGLLRQKRAARVDEVDARRDRSAPRSPARAGAS